MSHIHIKKLQFFIGYNFASLKILKQALTHRSANFYHNERLEFLGDAILNNIIAHILYVKFPLLNEGQMTRMRAILVCGEMLAKIAKKFDLGKYLFLGAGEIKSGGNKRTSILAGVIEALIGGIYLDSDSIETTRHLIFSWYKDELSNISLTKNLKDPKTQLQEYLQKKKLPLPKYSVVSTHKEGHISFFVVQCALIDPKMNAVSKGLSIRKAEQISAHQILIRLKIL